MDSWKKDLESQLQQQLKQKDDRTLAHRYVSAVPLSYSEQDRVEEALVDFFQIKNLSAQNPLLIRLYESESTELPLHVKLYRYGKPIPLSDILPMIENMGLKTDTERPYEIRIDKHLSYWISDFNVRAQKESLDIESLKDIFSEALIKISQGLCADDGFNKLVLNAGLSWSEVNIFRAYAQYMHQVGFRFSPAYVEKILNTYAPIARKLIEFFYLKFDPQASRKSKSLKRSLEEDILRDIDAISNLDEDYVIRYFWSLIQASLRTNFFQRTPAGGIKEYLAFKLESSKVPDLPPGQPLYEIFVYSTRFEGIHLRSAKVARGGIRWSERPEDFRTEVLGLMRAQKVKNAVIIPSGAKGGFILKKLAALPDLEAIKQEVIACYRLFIQGLLDLTDNFIDDKIKSPPNTLCYDEADPYLVVAADKGTATFSDLANEISKEYQFWLGDAFASGGSQGYDHKKMGITARGAWESIKRHFLELDIDIKHQNFTAVGIGDMSGDVFGNGMIYTDQICLIAAFDHRHIFIDPKPNPKKAFEERLRLFHLPTSSWADYNTALISKGGGIFKRSDKAIVLSAEIKEALAIQEDVLPPNELVKALLKAPVDLLFNGGIGTYVKASTQSHADVGDKTNEYCRINASELRCKIVGEGGNLGLTQLGRIEYALLGGLIYTDSIDNSAGVDCSDHEVNIKIMLNPKMRKRGLTEAKRNLLLAEMTSEVAHLVLQDNYKQALVLGFSAANTLSYSGLYQSFLKELEQAVHLDRTVEFLPDDKKFLERKASGQGLTRPELAIILSYTKIHITQELLKSDLPDDPYFVSALKTAFPARLAELYPKDMKKHPLHREIIATQLSNQIVNTAGITFMYRIQVETGQTIANIARAFTLATQSYQVDHLLELIDSLQFKVPVQTQYEFLHYLRQLINLATRWFLYHARFEGNIAALIQHYSKSIASLERLVPKLIAGVTKEYLNKLVAQSTSLEIPEEVAQKIALTRAMYTLLNVVEIATQHRFDLIRSAEVYFAVGIKFNLVWFRDQIATDAREGHWNNLSRLSLRDELDNLQRCLAISILKKDQKKLDANQLIDYWFTENIQIQQRWEQLLEMLMSSPSIDFTMFFIALRELSNLVIRAKK